MKENESVDFIDSVDSIVPQFPVINKSPYFLKNAPAVLEAAPACNDDDCPRKKSVRDQIKALNTEFFKLTKRQFQIMRENMSLQIEIFRTDWKYSSEFDEFISQFIGKKSAPLERKHSANEREYETIEARLKSIEGRIAELNASIK
jgi:hypothetical protein